MTNIVKNANYRKTEDAKKACRKCALFSVRDSGYYKYISCLRLGHKPKALNTCDQWIAKREQGS